MRSGLLIGGQIFWFELIWTILLGLKIIEMQRSMIMAQAMEYDGIASGLGIV